FSKKNNDCYSNRYHEQERIYSQQIWLDSGQIKIEAHIDSSELVIDSVFNSPTYYGHLDFRKNYSLLHKTNDTTEMNKMLLDFYSNNIDNPYSFVFADIYIRLNQNSKTNLSKLKLLTDKQGDRFNWFLLYPSVVERLNKILTVGSISLSDYSFIDRQSKNVKLLPLTKRYYILDFWFLLCAPCLLDHKEISKNKKILASKNAEIISISTDSDIVKWKKYLSKNKYYWQNYLESESKNITTDLKISSFPTYIVIDDLGNIVYVQNSFLEILKWLDKT
ncbi:TlpA family protein disulfide reductase, partial [Dolichospermum sp. ST_sed3]|nr:TlpA family protein disulfide reductase [Dolichospermum sp. ST_sed3]